MTISRRLLLTGAGAAFGASSLIGAPALVRAQGLTKIRYAVGSASLASSPVRIMKQLGIFERHGIDAELTIMDSGNAAATALISGSVDFAGAGPGEVLAASGRGQQMMCMLIVYRGPSGVLIMDSKWIEASGVKASDSLEARLKATHGAKIALISATSITPLAFVSAARDLGAVPNVSYMAQPTMPAALEAGAVEGILCASPFWTDAVLSGRAQMWVNQSGLELPEKYNPSHSVQVQVMRPYAEKNPETVRKVIAAFEDFAALFASDPETIKRAAAGIFPNLKPEALQLIFDVELQNWIPRRVTPEDLAHEIALLSTFGIKMEGIDKLDPAALIYGA